MKLRNTLMKLEETLIKVRKTLRKRMNNHLMKKASTSLVYCRIVTLMRWPKPKEPQTGLLVVIARFGGTLSV